MEAEREFKPAAEGHAADRGDGRLGHGVENIDDVDEGRARGGLPNSVMSAPPLNAALLEPTTIASTLVSSLACLRAS